MATKQFNDVKNILDKCIFNENIIHIILKHYWQLLDKRKVLWINIDKLEWNSVYLNPKFYRFT